MKVIGVTKEYKEMVNSIDPKQVNKYDGLFPFEVSRPWPNKELVAMPMQATLSPFGKCPYSPLTPVNDSWLIIV